MEECQQIVQRRPERLLDTSARRGDDSRSVCFADSHSCRRILDAPVGIVMKGDLVMVVLSDSYLRGARNRLLSLWRQVVTFRCHFLEMKTATDRIILFDAGFQIKLRGSGYKQCRGPEQMDLTTLMFGDINTDAGTRGHVGRDSPKLGMQHLTFILVSLHPLIPVPSLLRERIASLPFAFYANKNSVAVLVASSGVSVQLQTLGFREKRLIPQPSDRLIAPLSRCVLIPKCQMNDWSPAKMSSFLPAFTVVQLRASEVSQVVKLVRTCSRLNSAVRLRESVSLGRPVLKDQAQQEAEEEISQKTWEAMHLQVKGDLEKKELQERLKDLGALEGKHALLQSELVVAGETLEESHLQRDLLKQEKHELTMALEKAEQAVAELSEAQNKLSAEAADLHVATAKMSSMNEALALDKVQLGKLVLQLEQENEVLSGKVDEMERAKISDQEKLTLCERTNEELSAEKAHLEQLLKKAEEQQEGLQVELRILAEEKAETQEKLSQVYRQQESASSGLEQLRQESSRQGHALAKVCKEKELLVHEKAALEVRLAAVERDRQGLSEQLAEARSAKESLESRLFEAQQHLSQLEIARSQLEIQLHTVTQAKEVIQGEVKCLQCELEAERSLMRQERENMAQRLLRTEQQCDKTLRLQQTGHEVEINKLLQDLASEREGHHSEVQEMLEQWEKEKAETEREHEKKLFDMKQEIATMQAQQEEERTRVENAKQEVKTVKAESDALATMRALCHEGQGL
ncbi:uncharacterized protein WM294_010576 [Sarcoramphus papa]